MVESLAEWNRRKKWRSYLNQGEKETIDENRKMKENKGRSVAGRDQEAPSTGAETCFSHGPGSRGPALPKPPRCSSETLYFPPASSSSRAAPSNTAALAGLPGRRWPAQSQPGVCVWPSFAPVPTGYMYPRSNRLPNHRH